ncbi:MAG: DUF2867 domain-containing protein [Actinomycetota bacterium]
MRIAVVGASGYVGGRLVPRLVDAGHEVLALSRSGGADRPGVQPVAVDIGAEAGPVVDAAVYLVHSMAGGEDFAERDRRLAETFAGAARAAGVGRIVYLGGLGSGDLSDHLASRHEVGATLAASGVPVVELRAAVVLGSGSISFEMLRYLTERLPAMVCPRWIRTRIQPIAETDLLAHLQRALDDDVPPGVYEVGGPEVTTYREMIGAYARVRGLRPRWIVDVPLLTPGLSARWVDLVTPVDRQVSHTLIESLGTEVVVTDGARTRATFGIDCLGVDAALERALGDQAAEVPDRLFDLPTGTSDGLYAMHEHARVSPDDVADVRAGLGECGGDLGWYGLAWAWRLRILLGRPFGERLSLHRPAEVVPGATVDWWTVARSDDSALVLFTDRWFSGEAWLGYAIEPPPADDPDGDARLVQVGALRAKGLLGVVYWRVLWPVHLVVFELMAKRQAKVKQAAAR